MNRLLFLGALGGLLLGSPVWAANGDACDSAQFTKPTGGLVKPVWCVKVLDNISSASGGPVELNFANTTLRGLPDEIVFKVGQSDCTAGTVTIRSADVSGSSYEDLIAASSDLDVDSTSPAGNTAVRVNLHDIPLGQFINFRWSGGAGCTSGFDILAIGYERTR